MRFWAALLALAAVACDNTDSCDTRTADVSDICLPAAVAPGIPSVVDVREMCGIGCTGAPSCTALVRNGQVFLDVNQDVCVSATSSQSCLDLGCQRRVMQCTLPALPEGDYTLVPPGSPSRTIHVQSGGASSCRF